MKRLFVNIRVESSADASPGSVRLEVPGEIPVREVMEHLIEGMNWTRVIRDASGKDKEKFYWLEHDGVVLNDDRSLTALGIGNSAKLDVRSGEAMPAPGLGAGTQTALAHDIPRQNRSAQSSRVRITEPGYRIPESAFMDND